MNIGNRMNLLSTATILLALLSVNPVQAATYWVGSSAACTGANVHGSLPAALLAAAFTTENDEVRLTDTLSYTGNGNGNVTLTDWHPGVTGSLTIAGGYDDCFSAYNGGMTFMGNTNDTVITVTTSSQPSSIVTLRDLQISGGAYRGVTAVGPVSVTLDKVDISDNPSGMYVSGGAYVDLLWGSVIQNNDITSNVGYGGGIECRDNSYVDVRGLLARNRAEKGGNLHISSGCFVELHGGSVLEGNGLSGGMDAVDGGAIYVASGGSLYSNGGASRVIIRNHVADWGAGLYIVDSGSAILLNTAFQNNQGGGSHGGLIYAANGGTGSAQVVMDRVAPCPFLISCSEMEDNIYVNSLIFASNSLITINRTVIERNSSNLGLDGTPTIALASGNGRINLNRVGIQHNEATHILKVDGARIDLAHATIAGNSYEYDGSTFPSWVTLNVGTINIENSIFADTQGTDNRGGAIGARCNLVDEPGDLPGGTYEIGYAQFIDLANGDSRQLSSSPGVDMCHQDTFAWIGLNVDIEYQDVPVNDSTNPQGSPGDPGGLFDAGYDEVHSNVGEDEFTLTVVRNGTGNGTVISTSPLGIACGSDCTEVYFNGTVVQMTAIPAAGSLFTGWSGCDISSGDTCAIGMVADQTVWATFDQDGPVQHLLSVQRSGSGSGTVTSDIAGINCGADCSEPYDQGAVITLTATPTGGGSFSHWVGDCAVSGNQCTVTVDAAKTVNAAFNGIGTLFADSFE